MAGLSHIGTSRHFLLCLSSGHGKPNDLRRALGSLLRFLGAAEGGLAVGRQYRGEVVLELEAFRLAGSGVGYALAEDDDLGLVGEVQPGGAVVEHVSLSPPP